MSDSDLVSRYGDDEIRQDNDLLSDEAQRAYQQFLEEHGVGVVWRHLQNQLFAAWDPARVAGMSLPDLDALLSASLVTMYAFGRREAAKIIFAAYAAAVAREKALLIEELIEEVALERSDEQGADVVVYARSLLTDRRANRRPARPAYLRSIPPTASIAPPLH